jgi:hypothetical protein
MARWYTDLDNHTRTLDANWDTGNPYQIREKIYDGRLKTIESREFEL